MPSQQPIRHAAAAALGLMTMMGAALLGAAQTQSIGTLPSADNCTLQGLPQRVGAVNALCCANGGCHCTIACSSALLPLLDDTGCRPFLDLMLDLGDGVCDGVAGQLDDLKAQCLAIPPANVLGDLKEMHDAGNCSDEQLNGVARTEVTAAACADSPDVDCGTLMQGGLKCKDSIMVTNCRATCGMCGGHRRAQLASTCPLKQFDTDVAAVNTACCDDDECSEGVPTVCDAKCAIAFNDFFDRCQNILMLQMAEQMPGFMDLHSTCATRLPVEPLLRKLINCKAQQSGTHGSMSAYMDGSNILINGALDRCTVAHQGPTCDESTGLMTVDGCSDERSIPGWKVNNAVVSIEAQWPHRADGTGRTNIIKVGDAGSFSAIQQTVDTVVGQTYTISYDVWSEESETNTANKAFCTSVDSNGQLIIRAGETQTTCAIDGFCGTGAVAGSDTLRNETAHCHGQHRLCPESSDHWVTVSGTYTATAARTTIALHSEAAWPAYFDNVFMTSADDKCKPSTNSMFPNDPIMCQCSNLHESQQGTGNARDVAQDSRACKFTSGNTGKEAFIGGAYNQYAPPPPGVTNWKDAAECARTAPPPPPGGFYTPPPPPGAHEGEICVDVDTSSHGFTTTPHYVASFGAVSGAEHHMTTGASSIYHASPTGFRVYIKREHCHSCTSAQQMQNAQNPLTPLLAKERGYHINWVAEDPSSIGCTGAGDSQYSQWQQYCWQRDQCTGVMIDITFPLRFAETPVIVASLHGNKNNADARGGNAIYHASPSGFRVYVHSTAGTNTGDYFHQGTGNQANGGITVQEAQQWGWKVVYLAQEKGASNGAGQLSGTSSGIWTDAGEHLIETIVCHGGNTGGNTFGKTATVNYVTSLTGSSHMWTSDGASSIYTPTADSFRIYMFREGDHEGVQQCAPGQQPLQGCGCPNPLDQFAPVAPCCCPQGQACHTCSGTGSGGGHALTAAGATGDHWAINWIGVEN